MLILLIEARIWESLSGKRHYPIKTRVIIGQRSPITLHLFTLYQSYRAPVQLQEKRYPQLRGCFPLLLHCSRNNDSSAGLQPAASHAVSTAVVRRVLASARSPTRLSRHQIYAIVVSWIRNVKTAKSPCACPLMWLRA